MAFVKDFIHRLRSRPIKLVWCHRLPERSWHFRGKPVLCWRCTGITVGFFLPMILFFAVVFAIILLIIPFSAFYFVPNVWWIIISIGFIVPMAIDGLSQAFGYRMSNNLLRFITGTLYGIGLSVILYIIAFYVVVFFQNIVK